MKTFAQALTVVEEYLSWRCRTAYDAAPNPPPPYDNN